MSTEIIVSLISLAGTILTVWSGNRLTAYRISQLEEKVNKHNNLIDRMYKLENRVTVDEEKLKVLEDDLK